MSGNLIFGQDKAANSLHSISCDSNGHLDVNVATIDPATGLATEAKQDDMITDLTQIATNTTRLAPQLNRTEAIPVQIMVGSGGANYDALRANGQDLMVMIDDMNPDVAVNSGLSTATLQTAGNTILTDGTQKAQCMGNFSGAQVQIKVDANGVVETSGGGGGGGGDASAANQSLQLAQETVTATNSSSIDNKITQGSDITLTNAQQVLCYGRDSGGVLDALRTDASGHLEVVVDDFVKGQAAMAASFPVVIASDQSTIDVQTLRDADSTAISTTPVLANATFTSASVDMNGFSQLMIIGNTTNLTDQMDWYYSFDDATFFKGSQVLYDFLTGDFAEQPSAGVGARYIRVAQTDSTASNFTVQFASSKR